MANPTTNPGVRKHPNLIKKARELRAEGKTIREIALATGIAKATVSEITRGVLEPPLIRTCPLCREEFVTDQYKTRYCTVNHAQLALRYRKKGWEYSTFPRGHRKGGGVSDKVLESGLDRTVQT